MTSSSASVVLTQQDWLNSGLHTGILARATKVVFDLAGKSRFLLPALFAIGGISASMYTIYTVTSQLPSFAGIPFIEGTLYTDILIVLGAAIPIIAIEYFLIGIPVAALFLFVHRIAKSTAYDTNVMKIGTKFSGIRIIRRAAAPALFSVSTSGLIVGLIEGVLFETPPPIPESIRFLFPMSLTLMGALIIMAIALAFFIPTWILNDAGVVSHLKEGQLEIRQCPDTEGVGKWYSSMIGGYSLFAFPIAMFQAHFWVPYVIQANPLDITAPNLIISIIWTIGIPLLVMSFVVLVVMMHEVLMKRSVPAIQRMAKGLGGKTVERPVIAAAKE